jgi:hypothetical protein
MERVASYLVVELAIVTGFSMWIVKHESRTNMDIIESIVVVYEKIQTYQENKETANNHRRPHELKDGMPGGKFFGGILTL